MFRLKKWYLDCVSETGNAVILYWARVEWGRFRFYYGASLHCSPLKEPVHRHTFRPGIEPAMNNKAVDWSCQRLNVSGSWSSHMNEIECVLTDQTRGRILWNCVYPSAKAKICIDGDTVEGQGYVEHLTMTLKPWRLPFDELRWGRFLAPKASLVWIQWGGREPRTWGWLNGVEQKHVNAAENRIELPEDGTVLDLRNDRVIRSGSLSTTALRSIRALNTLIPGWGSAHETKWLAHGTLSRPDEVVSGWAIHEVVRWP